jgi:hypothetical protein
MRHRRVRIRRLGSYPDSHGHGYAHCHTYRSADQHAHPDPDAYSYGDLNSDRFADAYCTSNFHRDGDPNSDPNRDLFSNCAIR